MTVHYMYPFFVCCFYSHPFFFFFFNVTPTTEIYTLSLHDALPIWPTPRRRRTPGGARRPPCGHRDASCWSTPPRRSEEHTSELQSRLHLVCRLLLEKKNKPESQDPLVHGRRASDAVHNRCIHDLQR